MKKQSYDEFKDGVIKGIDAKYKGNTPFPIREMYIYRSFLHEDSLEDAIHNIERDSAAFDFDDF